MQIRPLFFTLGIGQPYAAVSLNVTLLLAVVPIKRRPIRARTGRIATFTVLGKAVVNSSTINDFFVVQHDNLPQNFASHAVANFCSESSKIG